MSNLILSPTGTIIAMSLNRASHNRFKNRDEYYIRLEFDGTTQAGNDFRNSIASINDRKVVTTNVSQPGNFIVSATTQFAPKVTDGEGVELEDVPGFTKGSTGTAIITLKPALSPQGNTVYLQGVALCSLELGTTDIEEGGHGLTALREAIANAKGN